MSNNYKFTWSDQTKPSFTLDQDVLDTSTTSLDLMGYSYQDWAANLQQDLLHLLEHFAGPSAPASPTTGQLWFDTNVNEMFVYYNGIWNVATNGVYVSGTAPVIQDGQLWFDLSTGMLKVSILGTWYAVGVSIGASAPANPYNGSLWLDTSNTFVDAEQTKVNTNLFNVYVSGSWHQLNTMRMADTVEYNSYANKLNNLLGIPQFIGTGGTTSAPVSTITLINGGANYTSVPTITISGGGGSGATATATLAGGQLLSLTLNNGGSGYTSAPTITISGGGGSGATATAYIAFTGSSVSSLTLTGTGNSYTSAPAVTISGGGGSGATANANLGAMTSYVNNLVLTNNGSGYTSAPGVYFSNTNTGTGVAGYTSISTPTAGVSGIYLTGAGSGYTSTPAVVFSGGGGSGAAGYATLGTAHQRVSSLPIASQASTGHTQASLILYGAAIRPANISLNQYCQNTACCGNECTLVGYNIIDGGDYLGVTPTYMLSGFGSGGTCGMTSIGAAITGVVLTNTGSGYTSAPSVAISGGGGSGGSAGLNMGTYTGYVNGIYLSNTGYGYAYAPAITISGGGGGNASAYATLGTLSAPVTSLTLTNGGKYYTSTPIVSFSGGGGAGAAATSSLGTNSGSVINLTITNTGSGYLMAPTVTIAGGGGSGATGTATVGGGPVATISLTNPGSGYTSIPTVTIAGGGGSGATAISTLAGVVSGSLGGTWANSTGMGQSTVSLISGRHPYTTEWSNFYSLVQSLSNLYGISAVTKDDSYVYAPDNSAYEGLSTLKKRFKAFSNEITSIANGGKSFNPLNYTTTSPINKTRTGLWQNNTYYHILNAQFTSVRAMEAYFNGGGNIGTSVLISSAVGTGAAAMLAFINALGPTIISGDKTKANWQSGTVSTNSSLGFYELTSSYQPLRASSSSNGVFFYEAEALVNTTTSTISVRISYRIGSLSGYTWTGTNDFIMASAFSTNTVSTAILSNPGLPAPSISADATSTF